MSSSRAWKSVLTVAGAALAGSLALAAPAAASVLSQPTATSYDLISNRITATTAAFISLIGAVIGGLAARAARRGGGAGGGRRKAVVAGILSVVGVVVGVLVFITADGGLNTGNGVAGAGPAVGFGAVGLVLAAVGLARARRAD